MWMPGFDRASPCGQHARKVIGMNKIGGGPTFQLVERLSKIIQALLTGELEFAFRRHSINQAVNAIDDLAKTLFARAQALLSQLPGLDVRRITHPQSHPTPHHPHAPPRGPTT